MVSLAEQCSVNSGLGFCVVTEVGGGYFGNIVCVLVFVVTASFSSRTYKFEKKYGDENMCLS